MYIETARLIIRDMEVSDTEALFKLKYDSEVMKYNPTFIKRDASVKDAYDLISYFISVRNSGDLSKEIYFAIVLKEANMLIGAITVSVAEYQNETQIGWMLLKEYTGMGYASEAGKAASDFLLETYSLEYMIVIMDIDNPASFRTAQKSGFRLFEKRVPYDYFYCKINAEDFDAVAEHFENNQKQVGSCYYYFRKYNPNSKIASRFYGDTVYDGRFA